MSGLTPNDDRIQVRGPDGAVTLFPAGTDDATIDRVMRSQYAASEPQSRSAFGDSDRSLSERATDFFQRAGDMVPFADEVRAAGYAVQDIATGGGLDGAWERARARDAGASSDAERRQGSLERLASDTLGLGTSILGPMAGARALGVTMPAAATRVGRGVQAGATGGLAGGVVGAGEGDTLEERSQNALGGMALGAGLGVGAYGLASGVSGLARGVQRALPANTPVVGQSARQRALERVTRRLGHDDLTAEQARQRIADMRRSGVDRASLMESGPSMRGLARTLRDQPGDGVRQLDDFVETRMQDMPGAIRSRLDDAFVPPSYQLTFPEEVVPRYERAVREQAAPLFQRVTGSISGQNRTLQEILRTPAGRAAFRQATIIARNRNIPFVDVYDEAGQLLDDMPNLPINFMHLVRQSLDDASGIATRRGAARGAAASIDNVRGRLDQILKAASPELREADEFFSVLMSGSDGARVGQRFDTIGTAAQLRQWVRQATPEQLMLARIQAANRLGGRIQDMANPTTQLRSGGNRLEAIRALFGSERAADDFVRHIDAQREIARTMQEVSGGSLTSRNLAQQDYEGMQLVAEGLADAATGGGVISMLRQSASRLIRRLPLGRIGDAERRVLINMLTETDPQKLGLLFGDIAEQQAQIAGRRATQGALANTSAATGVITSQ
jgi:hypothetical protein